MMATVLANVTLVAAIYNCMTRRRVCDHFKTRCGRPLVFHCAAVVTALVLNVVQASTGSQSAKQQQPLSSAVLGAKVSFPLHGEIRACSRRKTRPPGFVQNAYPFVTL